MTTTSRRTQDRITHVQFFATCEYLKNVAVDGYIPMNRIELAAQIESNLGFPISTYSTGQALKTVGIHWKGEKTGATKPKSRNKQAMLQEIDDLQEAVATLRSRQKWLESTMQSIAMAAGIDLDHGDTEQ